MSLGVSEARSVGCRESSQFWWARQPPAGHKLFQQGYRAFPQLLTPASGMSLEGEMARLLLVALVIGDTDAPREG